jgi:Protein of unknown function (DUF742)
VSRPYTVTGGRTRPRGTRYFDLVDMVVRSVRSADPNSVGSPERGQILELCRVPVSVAEVAALIGRPLGVVRVLLGDLVYENLIEVMESAPRGGVVSDHHLLGRVLERLRALLPGQRARRDLVDQAPAQRRGGGQPLAGEHEPRRAPAPDPAHHADRAARAGDHVYLRQSEERVRRGHHPGPRRRRSRCQPRRRHRARRP